MQSLRPTTLTAAAVAAACCLAPPTVSEAFMIPTSAARTPLPARTSPLRRSARLDSSKQAPHNPSRISAGVDSSSTPLSAKSASAPEASTPAATKEESVPSSAERKKTCDSGGDGSAPTFSYRKTFWQPFLPAEKSDPNFIPRSTTAEDGGSSESSTPANDPPTFLYRKTFWQPFAGASPTAAAPAETTATAAPALDESAPSSSAGRETTSDSSDSSDISDSAASTSSHRKIFWQPFQPAEKSDPESISRSTTAEDRGGNNSETSTPANDPPKFLYRKSFWQPFAGAVSTGATTTAAPAVGDDYSPTDSAKSVESSSAASSAATDATAVTSETATAEEDLPPQENESSSTEGAEVEEDAAPLPSASAKEDVPPPPAAKTVSAPPPLIAFEPEPTLITDSPVYQGAALNMKRAKEAFAPFTKKIQDNVAEGNVGERGEEWAIAQGVIIFFIGVGSIPVIGGLLMLLAGPGLVAAGAGVIAAGAKGLGKSLSPWPAPVEDNKLNTEGIYGMMRHPMYTGVVMLSLGFGVLTDSPLRMLLAVTLAVVLDKKAAKEEQMLLGLHGEAYENYLKAVAKFVPRIY